MGKSFFLDKSSRRVFFLQALVASLLTLVLPISGCSTFKGKREKERSVHEFDNEERTGAEKDVFSSEREKQSELSEFLAQNGRKTKTKNSLVRPGDDFLLSDKAKEIYANTER